jgi:DNA helicase-2/ATP-dependent DNA helicase PcrA
MPQRFFPHGQAARGDRHLYASRTRFIPASILAAFQQMSWPGVQAAQGRAPRPEVRVDIGARMRGMWK